MDNLETDRLAPRQPRRLSGVRRRSARTSVAILLALGSLLGASAVWASPASAAPTAAGVYPVCWYALPMYTDEGTYIRFYTWNTSERVWRRSNWYYVRGATQYEYTSSGWEASGTANFRLEQIGTVYVYVKTYTASRGWEGARLGRCINGVKYAGW